ncbi:methyltransferase family protein [Baaleninema simplex]|uniref:methyltransferase family protein n=1 Tax=Baaleninema simplex TaxID=2862350 RepID=UPI00034AD7E2|nr:isoprenylcysteine carboxylmethyltransferase family protein [Baaleninema simplex]
MNESVELRKIESEYVKIAIKSIVRLLIFLALIFLAAGRIDYWQGWVFSGIVLTYAAIAIVLFSDMPDLAKERDKPGPGMKGWDKVFWAFYRFLSLAIFVIAALDAGRFGWTKPLPVFVYVIAYLIYISSTIIVVWSMRVNKFFSSVVRIQTDRGQIVIDSGPYALVRHPGYVAGILIFISSPLLLGSVIGLIPGSLCAIALIIRTYLEDKTLQNELPSYLEYVEKVKYRLIPGIW